MQSGSLLAGALPTVRAGPDLQPVPLKIQARPLVMLAFRKKAEQMPNPVYDIQIKLVEIFANQITQSIYPKSY